MKKTDNALDRLIDRLLAYNPANVGSTTRNKRPARLRSVRRDVVEVHRPAPATPNSPSRTPRRDPDGDS